jgi:RsiW-degrading membrane proteinase PrsW (M82 family)
MQHELPSLASAVLCLLVLAFLCRQLREVSWIQALTFLLLGMASIIAVGLFGSALQAWVRGRIQHHFSYALFNVFFLEAIPEELARYVILYGCLPRRPPYSLRECLLLGCLVGLGFGGVEYVLYTWTGGWEACWQRAFTSLPYHTAAGGIIGYFVGAYLHQRYRWSWWGLVITIPLHAFNNFNLRHFESISMTDTEEPQHTLLQQILYSHWPSNLFVTTTVVAIAILLYRQANARMQNASE